ncbi:MAG TPA: RDD family protein [Thermoanaerobaculia bacterium]|nr:RDD family protein [Thermoanaerobaculia bacterium]
MRFDEIELEPVPFGVDDPIPEPVTQTGEAPRMKRLLALLTDLSLFVALALALSPLLPAARDVFAFAALAGFVLVLSYYYFVGTWLLWGKTIGGAIFDVKVVAEAKDAMSLRDATVRWVGMLLSLLTAGLGFVIAAFPSRRSLADRVSHTHCV